MHEAQERAGGREWSDDFVREAFRRLVDEHAAGRARAAEAIAERYIRLSVEHARLYPDVAPALDRLASRAPLAVITNGLVRDQRQKIERLGIADRFAAIVVSEEVGLQKPDAAIFALALEAMDCRADAAVYVGDNPAHDMVGAHAAGMAGVWLDRGEGFQVAPDDIDARGEAQIAVLTELPPLLGV